MPDSLLFDQQPSEIFVGREPSWIVRSGITLVFVTILSLLLITWFIRYPDTIYSEITITTSKPPIEMVSKATGRIMDLYVKNNQMVSKGQTLLLINSSVNYENLKRLEALLSKGKTQSNSAFISKLLVSDLSVDNLGKLQPAFNQLIFDLKALTNKMSSEQLAARTKNALVLSEEYQKLQQQLEKKKSTWVKKIALANELLEKKSKLLIKGVITSSDVLPDRNRYFDKQLALQDVNIQLELYEVKLKELQQNLKNFKIQRNEQIKKLTNTALRSYFLLINQINQWKHQYLYTSPIDGQVSFSDIWSANQQVKQGDVLITLSNKNKMIIGKIQVDQKGAGKIKTGQRVDIELNSFPAVEYGKITGKIKSISLVPGERGYLVDVSLPKELNTTYDKSLPFSPNLIGNAKIITQKKRLFERFLEKILYVFKKD